MLDRSYGNQTSATKKSDYGLLGIALLPLVLLVIFDELEYINFGVGLYLGMTLIQVYFHKFSAPLTPEKAPALPLSPIKVMSYAIQEKPSRPWLVLVIISMMALWILYEIATKGFEWF